jgi:tetratricopeptide (TPR) repeat protein
MHPTNAQPDEALIRLVNEAFKNYQSTLALSRSPLANSALVAPALVRDAVSPTADERGGALRLVLRWAVTRLAPEPVAYPLDTLRPYSDPTWRDPRWWRYTILRHRYLEPLHPDEFVEGGRYTETLIALTGIPTVDSFFDERNRAVREVAAWLFQQRNTGNANQAIAQMALQEALASLQYRPHERQMLTLAAIFNEVFPRAFLLSLAAAEHMPQAEAILAALIGERLLRTDQAAQELWLGPTIQAYLYAETPPAVRQARHQRAARVYAAAREPLRAAEHWQRAEHWSVAATVLLDARSDLIDEQQSDELLEALARFPAGSLPQSQGRAVQLLAADLALRLGRRDAALTACRAALRLSATPAEQAPLYRRLGKLYEQRNQRHALAYYQQAAERFDLADAELIILYKDRAWLYILRREWASAAADLAAALAATPDGNADRADIFDALASLHRYQGDLEQAVGYAQSALALREVDGSPARLADSFNNLGLLYSAGGEHDHALSAFGEALALYRRMGNVERTATTLLNSGMAHHLAGRLDAAVTAYRECLASVAAGGNTLLPVRAHYNLAEALAELGEPTPAAEHWRAAYALSTAAAFDDELRDLEELRRRFPALAAVHRPVAEPAQLDAEARLIVRLAEQMGRITPRQLMEAAAVSKATATRRLAELTQRGFLRQDGKGRATAYLPVVAEPARVEAPPGNATHPLYAYTAELASYGVTAIGVPPPAGDRLLVRFRALPDLARFFALEQRLSAILGRRIDLQPADLPGIASERAPIAWMHVETVL